MVILAGAEFDIILKIIFSSILGMIIGLERELDLQPAGLRTHALVCMGSALFAALSIVFVGDGADPSRIAAGIVTGIGFLGAGTIFVSKNTIKGLTTAADLWVIAGIGLAVGVGLYVVALATTIIVYMTLVFGRYIKKAENKKFSLIRRFNNSD